MTNGEKFMMANERQKAFDRFCEMGGGYRDCENCKLRKEEEVTACILAWLDLEAEEEKPMDCPFCGRKCVCVIDEHESFVIRCTNCDYTYGNAMDKEETIQVHNDLCKKAAANKGSEVK